MSGTQALQIEHLTYRYRTRDEQALIDCTFHADAGQIVLVAGGSGCGKTTLVRCINGLIPRSYKGGDLSGSIRIMGQDPATMKLADISRMVGTVLQDPEKQVIGSTVLTEVAFGLENMGVPRPEILQRVQQTLAFLGIEKLLARETSTLSGGEKQKVVIAGVLVMEPSILLLDEPLASLDPESARDTLRMVRQLADAGKTIIIIEHRVEDVITIMGSQDRALLLEEGHQRYFGDAAGFLEVAHSDELKLPAHMVLRRLIGIEAAEAALKTERSSEPIILPHTGFVTMLNRQAEPLIQFDQVSFGYEPDKLVLKEISLDFYPGDIIALMGPNGAGKSTMLKQMIGLLRPQAGHVLVHGIDTHRLTTAKIARSVGYVFQSPTHMLFAPTVREELSFGPRNLGLNERSIQANVQRSLEITDLLEYEERSPLSLSFGEQRRVGIAAILAMQSRILLMDEPTAGQDLKHYHQFMDAIISMPFETIIFITHDVDFAIRYANRVILFVDGGVVVDGPPESVLADRDHMQKARVLPTSLLEVNLALLPRTGAFGSVESLANLLHTPRSARERRGETEGRS